jgi:hypothetical protein
VALISNFSLEIRNASSSRTNVSVMLFVSLPFGKRKLSVAAWFEQLDSTE